MHYKLMLKNQHLKIKKKTYGNNYLHCSVHINNVLPLLATLRAQYCLSDWTAETLPRKLCKVHYRRELKGSKLPTANKKRQPNFAA